MATDGTTETTQAPDTGVTPATDGGSAPAPDPQPADNTVSEADANRQSMVDIASKMRPRKTSETILIADPKPKDGDAPGEKPATTTDGEPKDGEAGVSGKDAADDGKGGKDAPPPAADPKEPTSAEKGAATKARNSAVKALKLGNIPDKLIDRMDEKEILELGATLKEKQRKTSMDLEERTRVETILREIQAKNEADKALEQTNQPGNDPDPDDKPPEPAATGTIDQETGDLLKQIENDELLGETGKAISQMVQSQSAMITQLNQRLDKQGQDHDKALAQLAKDTGRVKEKSEADMIKAARTSLQDKYSVLKDDAKFETVKTAMYQLSQNADGYHDEQGNPDMEKLMRHSVTMEFHDEVEADRQSKLLLSQAREMESQAIPPSGDSTIEPTSSIPEDPKQAMIWAKQQLKENKNRDWVFEQLAKVGA